MLHEGISQVGGNGEQKERVDWSPHIYDAAQIGVTCEDIEHYVAALPPKAILMRYGTNTPSERKAAERGEAFKKNPLGNDHVMVVFKTDATSEIGGVCQAQEVPGAMMEVGLSLLPEHQGKGIAATMLVQLESMIRSRNPGVTGLIAVTRSDNRAVHATLRSAGFEFDSMELGDMIFVKMFKREE